MSIYLWLSAETRILASVQVDWLVIILHQSQLSCQKTTSPSCTALPPTKSHHLPSLPAKQSTWVVTSLHQARDTWSFLSSFNCWMSLMIFLQQQEPTTSSISTAGPGKEVLCLPAMYLAKVSMRTRSDCVTKARLACDSGLEHKVSFNASEGKKHLF